VLAVALPLHFIALLLRASRHPNLATTSRRPYIPIRLRLLPAVHLPHPPTSFLPRLKYKFL
jgi:hypothetical protein